MVLERVKSRSLLDWQVINCTSTYSEVKAMLTIDIKSLDSAFNDLTFLMPHYARFSKHLHSCLVTLATSSGWIVLFRINQNNKATQAEAHHNCPLSLQNIVLRTDRWRHVYRAVAGEGVRALWKEAETDEARLKQIHLTHAIPCVHIRIYGMVETGFPVI